MQDFTDAWLLAGSLLWHADADLLAIIGLSLRVSLTAVLIAAILGFPVGAFLATCRFPTRNGWVVLITALMGLPPVVVGLLVYMALSKAGPLGWLGFLYTPTAMIIAQTVLVFPIIAALSRQIIEDANIEYTELFLSLSLSPGKRICALLYDTRYSLLTVLLAGFGRAIAEVGAVILVGGNIHHLTRVMTSAIALETAKGDLGLALALGIILLAIALGINALAMLLKQTAAH